MSTSTTTNPLANIGILTARHMTAFVNTENGSAYTVVSRPQIGVWMYKENSNRAEQGTRLTVENGRMVLWLSNGRRLVTLSAVSRVQIVSN